jgi:hypothetical protein
MRKRMKSRTKPPSGRREERKLLVLAFVDALTDILRAERSNAAA